MKQYLITEYVTGSRTAIVEAIDEEEALAKRPHSLSQEWDYDLDLQEREIEET